ncbi:MAG: Bile acid:sodium symporter [Bacteroidetes bacterium]|nr:Bile acid:sodium symporter [Bacteroidota bacterium]
MMPFTMTVGALFYPFFGKFDFLTPYLIFLMLFFTYCGMSVRKIRFSRMHLWLILIQVFGSMGLYLLLKNVDVTLAQAGLICLLAPTATSAVVITGMLKGNTASLTAYTLLSNFTVAIMAPFLFSIWGANTEVSFCDSFMHIAQRVFILLLGPLLLAILLRRIWPSAVVSIQKNSVVSFYLWVIALAIVTATTVKFIFMRDHHHFYLEIGIAILALVASVCQFFMGKRIGNFYNDKIAGGQGLGQKNTILAIWLTHTYLNPLASIAPGAYILWQNIINSWQLWRIRREL